VVLASVLATGCGEPPESAHESADSAGAGGTQAAPADHMPESNAGAGGSGSTTDLSASASLAPLPLDALGCVGPMFYDGSGGSGPDGGPSGRQCCFRQFCYTPSPGAACGADPMVSSRWRLFQASAGCSCTSLDIGRPAVAGPFAPNPEGPEANGSCCYAVAMIGCD